MSRVDFEVVAIAPKESILRVLCARTVSSVRGVLGVDGEDGEDGEDGGDEGTGDSERCCCAAVANVCSPSFQYS